MGQCREPGKNRQLFFFSYPRRRAGRGFMRGLLVPGPLDLKPASFALETDRLIYGIVLRRLARTSYEIIND